MIGLGITLTKIAALAGAAAAEVIEAGLALWHKMTNVGVDVVGDGSASFNGTSSYVDVSGLTLTGSDFTFSFWTKADAAGNMYLFDATGGDRLLLTRSYSSLVKIYTDGWKNFGSVPSVDEWHHYAFTISGTTAKCYIDGEQNGGDITLTSALDLSSWTLARIGREASGSPFYFSGEMSKVGVWSAALTRAEIVSIMGKSYADLTTAEKTNLVSWYELESDSNDSHGSNNGTDTAITYVDETPSFRRLTDSSDEGNSLDLYTGRGFSFDGVNDYIEIGDVTELDFERTDSFSIGFYVSFDGSNGFNSLIGKRDNSSPYSGYEIVYNDSTESLAFSIGNTDATNEVEINSSFTFSPGEWYHIFATYDGSSDVSGLNLYKDGVVLGVDSSTNTLTATIQNAIPVTFGQRNSATINFAGDLSNVKIFDTELSAAQVLELYQNPEQILPTGVTSANLVGWWPLTEGENAGLVFDGSGNGNHGTINGATEVFALPAPATQVALMGQNRPMWFDNTDDYITLDTEFLPADSFTFFANYINRQAGGVLMALNAGGGTYIRDYGTSVNFYIQCAGDDLFEGVSGLAGYDKQKKLVINAVSGATKAYQNGTNVYNGTDATDFDGVAGKGLQKIGIYSTGRLDGAIFEIAIFDTVLTNQEAQDLSDGTITADDSSLSAKLWGYWKNTGNTDADWTDLSTNSNDGTVNGSPTTILLPEGTTTGSDTLGATLSKANNGELIFDGNNYATVYDDSTLDITTAITLEAWVKPFSVSAAQTIIGKNAAYQLEITSGAKPSFSRWSTTETATATTTTTLTADTWYHIAVTYDSSNVNIYIDGSLDTGPTSVTGAIDTNANDCIIGALTTSTEIFDGYIDSAKIYDSALTAADILNNYNAEKSNYS